VRDFVNWKNAFLDANDEELLKFRDNVKEQLKKQKESEKG